MSGSLQSKIYGNHRHSSTVLKRMGSYHSGPVKRMGCCNNSTKQLSSYNGVGGGKNNLVGEIYPRY